MQTDDAFSGFIREMVGKKPTTEAKHNGTGMNDLSSSSKNDLMRAPVHLSFLTRRMVNGWCGAPKRRWPDDTNIPLEDGIASLIAKLCDLFQNPHSSEMLFPDQIAYFRLVWIKFARPMMRSRRIGEWIGKSFELSAYSVAANTRSFDGLSYGTGFFEYFPNICSLLVS